MFTILRLCNGLVVVLPIKRVGGRGGGGDSNEYDISSVPNEF